MAAIDVRAVLDGKVWPQDVHDFVGDVVDILDEQFAQAGPAERDAAARDLLDLLADDDLVIRTWAVVGIRRALRVLGDDAVFGALDTHRDALSVAGVSLWQVSQPTLLAEARYRLDY
ncbi:MAG: hypothetical protein WCH93_03995 [Actinomycetota bacterium]